MKTLALEFGTNLFGNLSKEVKERLQAVIDNPCEETWEDSYSLILTFKPMITLWQAVGKFDSKLQKSKPCNSKWEYIPDGKTIAHAISKTILNPRNLN